MTKAITPSFDVRLIYRRPILGEDGAYRESVESAVYTAMPTPPLVEHGPSAVTVHLSAGESYTLPPGALLLLHVEQQQGTDG